MIVCVGLATRDTIFAVPRHPDPDDRVVATERVVAGGDPAVAAVRLGADARFVGIVEGELDGVDVVRRHDAVLLGAVGDPSVPGHVTLWGLLLPLRQGLGLWATSAPRGCRTPRGTATCSGTR